jgi:hypothetical protein
MDEPGDKLFTAVMGPLLPKAAIRLAAPRAVQFAAAIARSSLVITDAPAVAGLSAGLGTPVIEVSEAGNESSPASEVHRIISGSSRARVSTDEVYDLASVLIQTVRSSQLFR